ncbi:MAG: HxsD-like protein [Butyrivibrio sp.]|jgi:hypothetical protein|nr:HxsD-like protein [Butyrivibrio sp.]
MNNINKFTKEFYDINTIKSAIKAYSEIAQFNITEDNNYYYCDVISCKYDPVLVLNEFSNYVLGTMNI